MENMGYYEPDDCFICKNGRHLDLSSHYTSHAKDGTERKISVYRCEDCSGCPYRTACCKAKDSEKRKEIFVCWEFQNLRKNSYHNITTEEGKLLRCNRSIQAEWCCTIKVDIENSKGQYIEKDKQEATKDGSESTKIQHGI